LVFETRAPATTVRIFETVDTLSLGRITDHTIQATLVIDRAVRLTVVVPAANFIPTTVRIGLTLDTPALVISVTPPV